MCNIMLLQKFSNRKILVDILALFFGIGAWAGINGIFVQQPLLIYFVPEGWSLAVYIVVLVQIANLGPILYTLYSKYLAWGRDHYIIYALLGCSTVALYILAFNYDKTSVVFGEEHSTFLLGAVLVVAFVGCTASVLFMPFMRNFREIYLITYLVGEGLSGFIPSIVALVQGVGGNAECVNVTKPGGPLEYIETKPDPRFSPQVYFLFLGTLLFVSLLSFIGLNNLKVAKGERVKLPASTEALPTDMNAPPSFKTTSEWSMPNKTCIFLLGMMSTVTLLGNGLLPSIEAYSAAAYGNVAYHFAINLAAMSLPTAMCLGFVTQIPKVKTLTYLWLSLLTLAVIIFYIALSSPSPPLQKSLVGRILIVIIWILTSGLIGFIKMSITSTFRPHPGKGLYHVGVATQTGSLTGAVIAVVLAYAGLFTAYHPCDELKGH